MIDTSGFAEPDWNAPLDVEAALAATPDTAHVRGMFINDLVALLKEAGAPLPDKRYVAFSNYPLRDYMKLCVEVAEARYGDVPLREGIRRIGQRAYPVFADSMIGRVVFGVLDGNYPAMIKIANKGYEMSQNEAECEVVEQNDHQAVLRMHVYNFLDSMHVGLFEGSLTAVKLNGRVRVKMETPSRGELLVEWEPRA